MNARALRRLFLPLAMAAVVGGSVYAATGTSSAASTSKLAGPAAVRVVFTVRNNEGKIIQSETGVAAVVRIGVGSAAATVAGVASPQFGVGGPSEVCLAHVYYSAKAKPGHSVGIQWKFASPPFVAGSSFNAIKFYKNAIEFSEQPGGGGDVVDVDVENADSVTQTFTGYYSVLYWNAGC